MELSKIAMIKAVRTEIMNQTGLNLGTLKVAKDMVDAGWNDLVRFVKSKETPVVGKIYRVWTTDEFVTVLYVDLITLTALVRYNAYNENPVVIPFSTLVEAK